ncbi:CrcB family protein [Pseudarthrobacter oxydans]|uniref:Fluoride-specific ion channel FluC n=1 Tax=Pseudarthrobacter oxydans TaxID=1671 RepID=A0AAW8N781_PSEOX|nr:CrcB family protein [Pseudarthrobacter oxydans]MDR6792354.1 CrcB protein [Pseudarthrobacter oxydans]MDR7162085.1 CrcB protein [Pseudarthrobacter oxydans]
MTAAALVGIFGVAGALLRFGIDSWFAHHSSRQTVRAGNHGAGTPVRLHWPWATLLVNVVGCFIIGAAHGLTVELGLGAEWQAALATGLAGGLTTFSSWTTATVRLLSEERLGSAAVNVAANLVLGLAAAAAGIALVSAV